MKYLILLFLILILPLSSFGAIDLPWSTTYNGDDWTIYTDPLNCDGLSKGGGTPAGTHYEEIISDANYSGGGGYKGQRHWCGFSNTEGCSGGTIVKFNTPVTEVWIRFYLTFESGFSWANHNYGVKSLYLLDASYTNINYFLVGYGLDSLNYYTQNGDHLYYNSDPTGCGWATLWGDGGDNPSNGSWHCFEYHIKSETDNNKDGEFDIWVDGRLVSHHTDVKHGIVSNGVQIGGFVIGSNLTSGGPPSYMWMQFDDFVVSTTGYIGPLINSLRGTIRGGTLQ